MTQTQKSVFWFFLTIVFFYAIFVLRDVLLPFVAGFILAYFLDPLTEKIEKKVHSRTTAVGLVFGFAGFVFFISMLIIVPLLEKQIVLFAQNVPDYVSQIKTQISPLLERFQDKFPEHLESIRESLADKTSNLFNFLGKTLKRLLSGSVALLNVFSLLIITPVVALYLLLDWRNLNSEILSLIPRSKEWTVRELLVQINSIVAGFIRGQACVCLILGIFYAVTLTFIGLDLGLLIGLFIGCICFIPYLGSTLGLLISVTMVFIQYHSWQRTLVVLIVFFLGQAIEGNYLTPKLIGDKIGLHPVWIIFALMTGASLFGFLGVLLAVPVAAVIGVLVRFAVRQYKESPLYLDIPTDKNDF